MDDLARKALTRAIGSAALLESLPIGIYCCAPDGTIVAFNRRAAELWGQAPSADDTSERFWGSLRLLLPDGKPLAHGQTPMAEALLSREPVRNVRIKLEQPEGSHIDLVVNVEPVFEQDGSFIGTINCLQDITEVARTEVEAAHLAAIVASSNDAIVSKTLNGLIRSWNAGAERMFGYEAEEVVGRPITVIIPPELYREENEILARLQRGEQIDHFETERVAKDGRRICISLTVSPVRNRQGHIIGASKVARDITDRKRAEQLQKLLISELNHRVKNTLATVQSIANQTVRLAHSPSEFAASFSGRLQALAHTHDILTRGSWQGADVGLLVRDQLLINGAEDERISFSGPFVTLDPQPSLHLALVLHELGTNARKYGSLSVHSGRLSVSWTVRSGQDTRLLLTWQELGGPVVSVPARRGFGTTLIEKSLAAHGGDVSIQYNAEGVMCEIMLPIRERGELREEAAKNIIRTATPQAVSRTAADGPDLEGKRVLVVEDEPLIAMDIAATLSEAGCIVVGPASTDEKARQLIEEKALDLALLDANLNGKPAEDVAALLTRRGIPFAILTGYERENLPETFRQMPLVKKPFTREEALGIIDRLAADVTILPFRRSRH